MKNEIRLGFVIPSEGGLPHASGVLNEAGLASLGWSGAGNPNEGSRLVFRA